MGACGIYCGECDVYVASSEGDRERQVDIAESISRQFDTEIEAEQIVCEGCRGPLERNFCVACKIRPCAKTKGVATCAECREFESCETLACFHRTGIGKPARENLLEIRRIGLEEWVERKRRG